ncbi:MAG: hypothetical protein Q8O93_01445 [bacterium]|nr:hypothetical protein [bacterium]
MSDKKDVDFECIFGKTCDYREEGFGCRISQQQRQKFGACTPVTKFILTKDKTNMRFAHA